MIVIGIYLLKNINNPFAKSKTTIAVFGSLALIIGVCVFGVILSTYLMGIYKVYIPYQNGEYLEVEGTVENLKTTEFLGNGNDEFDVEDVHFIIGDPLAPGYQKMASSYGLVNREGIKVRIQYVSAGDMNYIVRLEIVEELSTD